VVADAVSRQSSDRILTRVELLDGPRPGLTVHRYGSDERYGFEPPRHVGALPDALRAKVGECTVPTPFLVEVADATVIGPTGIVVADGRVLLESTLGGYERLVDSSVRALLAGQIPVETRLQRPDDRYDEPVFSLVGPWATDYYHWLADYLVQVFALETFRDRTGDDPLVLVPADPPTWLTESLPLAGIDPDRTIEWSGTRARCSRLVLGSARRHTASTGDGYIHSPAALSRLGSRIRNAVDGDAGGDGSRRLYVSRADAADRRVRNEADLVDALDDYGFERIVPGDHSFTEQVRRFSEAEVVVGPHGAGLTNLIFTPSATLVELFGSYHNACFFTLARGMGHEYACVAGRPTGPDLTVDVGDVTSLVDELLAEA
jgi:capsular polysaccharide biosynthesis protein